jgi:uncharacterized protein YggT (Ycf19 family)
MGLFITDPVGLIIALLNVTTFVLIVYVFLQLAAEGRSKLLYILDRGFAPLLAPLRRVLPVWRVDTASIICIAVLQIVAFVLKKRFR